VALAFSVEDHFKNKGPNVASTYAALTKALKKLGPFREEAKKTSIHLVRTTAFAGVATRKSWIILTVKSANDIKSPRILKHEQVSAGRWHLEVRLAAPQDIDAELRKWLASAYGLS
jgi:hypothetical protein